MSHSIVDLHPAGQGQGRRRSRRADWLMMTAAVALATVISLAAFLLISHYGQ